MLRAVRLDRGITQAQAADQIDDYGIDQPTYSRWENARHVPASPRPRFRLMTWLIEGNETSDK